MMEESSLDSELHGDKDSDCFAHYYYISKAYKRTNKTLLNKSFLNEWVNEWMTHIKWLSLGSRIMGDFWFFSFVLKCVFCFPSCTQIAFVMRKIKTEDAKF